MLSGIGKDCNRCVFNLTIMSDRFVNLTKCHGRHVHNVADQICETHKMLRQLCFNLHMLVEQACETSQHDTADMFSSPSERVPACCLGKVSRSHWDSDTGIREFHPLGCWFAGLFVVLFSSSVWWGGARLDGERLSQGSQACFLRGRRRWTC